jgi:hypothetical protein
MPARRLPVVYQDPELGQTCDRTANNSSDYYSFVSDKLWQDECGWLRMPRKKKPKRFQAVKAVKELARERVGTPPAAKIVLEKKKKPEKHKPTLSKLLQESE